MTAASADALAPSRLRRGATRTGAKILLDTASPELSDPRVRLNGGPYVLVEFPRLNLPVGSEDALGHIAGIGYRPVVAHVERYLYQGDPVPLWDEWRHAGAAHCTGIAGAPFAIACVFDMLFPTGSL